MPTMRIGTISLIVVAVVALFWLAYRLYGRFLRNRFGLDDERPTPGDDNIPVHLLLPQHFSAIAAAGPIVGPILAGLWFGWLPALLWIVIGNIFIGAVHDFSTLSASIRHGGKSIAAVIEKQMGGKGSLFFSIFIWIALVYVIVAFTDITASTFVDKTLGGAVATSSILYLLLAIGMGFLTRRAEIAFPGSKTASLLITAMAIALLILIIWGSQHIPISFPETSFLSPAKGWGILILVYCFFASILPMPILLQPRGALGGYFLYGSLIIAIVGLFLGGYDVKYPAFVGLTSPKGAFIFPALFITIACGACSGFHGLVCCGTTSKQLKKEGDALPVGYGGMLLEGLVAVTALATVMIFAKGDPALGKGPTEIYANGLAQFASLLGVPQTYAMTFGLLAFATFVYDTLDITTRLGRHILEELTGWTGWAGQMGATAATLALPFFFLVTTGEAAYLKFWPLFGASNQLLAALSLLGISVWLIKTGQNPWYTLAPMLFLLLTTLWALLLFIKPSVTNLAPDVNGLVALVLLAIALLLLFEAYRAVSAKR
jgi:carbon starvation protein